jgi:dTDP-D-glucose 4,6-dehydratase
MGVRLFYFHRRDARERTDLAERRDWEPNTPLDQGLAVTYKWIHEQYHNRKKGRRVVEQFVRARIKGRRRPV